MKKFLNSDWLKAVQAVYFFATTTFQSGEYFRAIDQNFSELQMPIYEYS